MYVASNNELPVDEVKTLLACIPQSRAPSFLARMPVNADDGPCVLEFGVEHDIDVRNEKLAALRDLYLAHFTPYFDSASHAEGQRTLDAMARAWTPPVVVTAIRDFAAHREINRVERA